QDLERPARLTTVPLSFKGKVLVTADILGSMTVSLIDSEGGTIAVSDPVSKTCTGHALSWDRALKPEKREGVRLRFNLDRAKIYSFRFK
ncbi:MAG: hypothetical protein VX407_04795, partial [Verrucomicrobiota bacterium]|nr:hypothetical protein [Verrucomicrobiota bacterium]